MSFFRFLRLLIRRSLRNNKKNDNTNSNTSHNSLHTSSAVNCITSASPSGVNSNVASTSSTLPQYRYEGGRRFHNDANVFYALPNDTEEDDRIHMQHWVIELAFGSNFDAPVKKALEDGTNVLDSACGPATWTLEMANAYPYSTFYGTDVCSRFPNDIKPRNCEFIIHNILDELPFDGNYFGYIHQRLLLFAIKVADWPKLLENLKRSLKPEGWVELTECSLYKSESIGPTIRLATDLTLKIMTTTGLDPDIEPKLAKLLSDAGFTNIQTRSIIMPINHGGKVGELFWGTVKETFISAKSILCKMHPGFQETGVYEKFIEDLGEEFKNNKSTIQWTRAIAQKPLLSIN